MGVDGSMNCSLGDLAAGTKNALVGGPFGSNLVSADYVPDGVPVIRGQNMGFGRWVEGDFVFVTPEKADTLSANIARPGDLVFTQRGTLGQVAIVPKGRFERYVISQSQMKVTIDERKANALFLYYYFTSQEALEYFRLNTIQTGVPHTNLGILRTIPIPLPPLAEQHAIAHILGTLDGKIELNRRMNETLEAMARVLFKSWFVDFDPVRAKAEGRDPGFPEEIADLFPDHFEDSELGEIPAGWTVVTLGEMATIQGGKQLPTEECRPIGTHVVFGANGIMGYAERATHEGFVIAFGRVGAYCGSLHWTYRGAWINNNASAVVPLRWPEFVLQAMLNIDFESMRTGSAQPFIPNSAVASTRILRPAHALFDACCSVIHPVRIKQSALNEESRTLAALRDTLLPKLISGELRVIDAERIAGSHAL